MSSVSEIDQKQMVKGVTYVAAAVSMPEITSLVERMNHLEAVVASLTIQLEHVQAQLNRKVSPPIQMKLSRPKSEIMIAVASYLKKKGEAYPSEIADELGVSLKEVLAAISVLQKEKKVVEV
jgi:hypothetical protein